MDKMPGNIAQLPGDQRVSTPKKIVQPDEPDVNQAVTHGDQPGLLPGDMPKLDDSDAMHIAESVGGEAPSGERTVSTSDESTGDGTVSSSLKASAEAGAEDHVGGTSTVAVDLGLSEAPKEKKKKGKSKKGKTLRKITGFEDGYADAPTTPQEAAEEKKLYSREFPFAQRIEECIQRYRSKRRLDSPRAFLLDKYLFLGGIDSSQRQFQGMDLDEAKTATAEEIRAMSARDVIHHGYAGSKFYDPDDTEHWAVDFEGIVKGFLSRFVPECYPRSEEGFHVDNEQAANLIRNFLNYVLQHDVCPEYQSQVYAARAICDIAPTELHNIHELFRDIPDSFNTAARHLFCDGGVHMLDKPQTESEEIVKPGWEGLDPNFRPKKLDSFTQLVIFRFAVMATAKNDKLKELVGQDAPTQIRVVGSEEQHVYQVVSVHRPSRKKKDLWHRLLEAEGQAGNVKPVGTIILRPSIIDHAYSNVPRPDQVDFSNEPTERFILDDDVLAKIEVGMKLELVVCELNIGLRFIKQVLDVRVSFDTFLPQSLMLNWKDPVENERPAPSVHDPPAEEKTFDDAPFGDND